MSTEQPSAPESAAKSSLVSGPFTRADLMALTKARLSALVVVTTMFGFLLGVKGQDIFPWLKLLNTLIGTTLCAFAAAVYNQILEVEADSRMERTSDRPLPGKRIPTEMAFLLGWLLAAAGVLHLLMTVNLPAAGLAAATIAVYIFLYTPLKSRSSINTLVGAVSGALPPLIGWAATGRDLWAFEALFLFGLLFFWQLPHFLAINWMYREQYEQGGFVMWSNHDVDGRRSSFLALLFSSMMLAFMMLPYLMGRATFFYLLGAGLLTAGLFSMALKFYRDRERSVARRLFFYTLLYLPLVLIVVFFTWR